MCQAPILAEISSVCRHASMSLQLHAHDETLIILVQIMWFELLMWVYKFHWFERSMWSEDEVPCGLVILDILSVCGQCLACSCLAEISFKKIHRNTLKHMRTHACRTDTVRTLSERERKKETVIQTVTKKEMQHQHFRYAPAIHHKKVNRGKDAKKCTSAAAEASATSAASAAAQTNVHTSKSRND